MCAAVATNNSENIDAASVILHPGVHPEPPFELSELELFKVAKAELIGDGNSSTLSIVYPSDFGLAPIKGEVCKLDQNNKVSDHMELHLSYELFPGLIVEGDCDIRIYVEKITCERYHASDFDGDYYSDEEDYSEEETDPEVSDDEEDVALHN